MIYRLLLMPFVVSKDPVAVVRIGQASEVDTGN
jgi:hypothetical protein